jgi:hypothetical protein
VRAQARGFQPIDMTEDVPFDILRTDLAAILGDAGRAAARDVEEVVRRSAAHEVDFLPPGSVPGA